MLDYGRPTEPEMHPLSGCEPGGPSCKSGLTSFECAELRIAELVDVPGSSPAAPCSCLDSRIAREECRFLAAETLMRATGPAGLVRAVGICRSAPLFRENCLSHLIPILANAPPPLTAVEAWGARIDGAAVVRRSYQGCERPNADSAVHAFWSQSLHKAFVGEVLFDPRLAVSLPPEAQPHLRAVVAWLVVARAPEPPQSLTGWRIAVKRALASGRLPGEPGEPMVELKRGLFPVVLETPRSVSNTHYLTTSTRELSPDPERDLDICVLQALARLRPEQHEPFRQALESDDGALSYAANRLLLILAE